MGRIRLTSWICALVLALCVVFAASRAHAQTAPKGAPPRGASTARTSPAASAAALTPAWRAFYGGDLDRAATLAKAAVTANARDAGARLVLARVAMERRDRQTAYTELRLAQQRAPDDPDILYYLAVVSGDLAREAFDALFTLAPGSPRVHQLMAESLVAEEKLREAEAEYEAALKADPKLLDALLGLGKLKRIRLACDEAIALYEKAEGIRPTFDGAFGLGTCLAVQQEDQKAIVQFKRALAIDQQAAIAWEGLGTALARTGQVAEGIAALERAVALEPAMAEAYYALGQAYRKAGNDERARTAFEQAQRLRTAEPR